MRLPGNRHSAGAVPAPSYPHPATHTVSYRIPQGTYTSITTPGQSAHTKACGACHTPYAPQLAAPHSTVTPLPRARLPTTRRPENITHTATGCAPVCAQHRAHPQPPAYCSTPRTVRGCRPGAPGPHQRSPATALPLLNTRPAHHRRLAPLLPHPNIPSLPQRCSLATPP